MTDVRPDGPAAKQGIRRGDVLVGMHIWETITLDNVNYMLDRPDFATLEPVKFYILRGTETLYGHLTVARNHAVTRGATATARCDDFGLRSVARAIRQCSHGSRIHRLAARTFAGASIAGRRTGR